MKTELLKLIAPTSEEKGCIEYNLLQDNDNPTMFIFYETWERAVFFGKHMNSDHFKAYINAVDRMIEDKAVHKMTRIESRVP